MKTKTGFIVEAEGMFTTCETEALALEEAEQLMQFNPGLDIVSIYKLYKTGKRQMDIQWTNGKLEAPKSNGAYSQWTTDEDSYLVGARQAGKSYAEIAAALNRTAHAVEVRASKFRCG